MTKLIEVGQRVYWGLYGGKYGTVFNIYGEQKPETLRTLGGGFISTGGNASFDIVFDNGDISRKVPESIVESVQWSVLWEEPLEHPLVTDDRLRFAEKCKREAELTEVERQMRLEHRRNQYKAENPDLELSSRQYGSAALGAKNIRKQLKKAFPKVKFSVTSETFSGGDSIRVRWELGPTVAQVKVITANYERGSFNSMEDIYENDRNNVWPELFGGSKYVTESRDIPDGLMDHLMADFGKLARVEGEGHNARFGSQYVSCCIREILRDFVVPVGDSITSLRHGNSEGETYIVPVLASEAPKPKARYRYNHATDSLVAA